MPCKYFDITSTLIARITLWRKEGKEIKIHEIRVAMGGTVNLGNFENLKYEAEATASLREGEDSKKAYEELWNQVEGEVILKIKQIKEDMRKGRNGK